MKIGVEQKEDSGLQTLNGSYGAVFQYRKVNGIVSVSLNSNLSGLTAGANNLLGTLPEGFRPAVKPLISAYNGSGYFVLFDNGEIQYRPNAASGWTGFLATYVAQ